MEVVAKVYARDHPGVKFLRCANFLFGCWVVMGKCTKKKPMHQKRQEFRPFGGAGAERSPYQLGRILSVGNSSTGRRQPTNGAGDHLPTVRLEPPRALVARPSRLPCSSRADVVL